MVHKQDKKRIQKEFDNFIDGKKTKLFLEYQIQKSNGDYIWVREHGVMKRDSEDGHAKYMVGIFHNLENDGNVDRTTGLYMYDKGKENFDVFMHNHVGESGTILLLGIDDFASINAINDHSFGDRVLRTIVQDIQTLLPKQTSFYRYDGDQLLILGKRVAKDEMKILYDKIQLKAKKAHEMDGQSFSLSFSAGMVAYPDDGLQWQDLVKRASLALKKAKEVGKNCCIQYEKELLNENIYEQMISRLMNKSVQNNCEGFRVVYQPVCESKHMSIYGAEALLRFDAPNGKTLRPDTFIPFLESNKLIIPVGTWVLEQAIIMCKKWLKEYPDFVMNVNVSCVQLYSDDFCDVVSHLLNKYRLEARHLTLELTESYFVNDANDIITTLEKLHEMDIKLAMDDFGSGYSSLARLTQLHVDIVKIDKIFVQTLQTSSYTQNFIDAVVRLCHDMGLKVCVEGVETCFEQRYISMMRADFIQGYYVSRPMDADEFYNLYIQKEIDTSLLAITPDREVRRKQLTGDANFLQLLIDTTPMAMIIWNRDVEIISCNREALNLYGVESEASLLNEFYRFSPKTQEDGEQSKAKAERKIKEAFISGYVEFNWQHIDVNGVLIPCEVQCTRIEHHDDFILVSYTRDIRKQVEEEEQIRQTNSRIHALLDATPLCVNLWNRNLENTMCNQEAVKLFDLENEQQYIDYFNKLSPEYQPNGTRSDILSSEKIKEAFTKGYSQFKWMHCKLNREQIPAEITLVRIKDLDDNNEDMVAGYTRDIREQLANEEQIVKANSRIRALLDATPLCVNLWNRNMENMICNHEAVKLFDLKNEDEYIKEFFNLSPEYQPNGERSDRMSFEKITEAFEKGYSKFEWMHCKLNGEEIAAEITLVRIEGLDDDGSDMVAGYTRDIRQQLEVTEIERKANQRIIAILNASPLSCLLWNDDSECIDCNQVSIDLFGVNTREELIHSFDDFMPFYQPDGTVSKDKKQYLLQKIKVDKRLTFEWLYRNKNNVDIPCEVSLVSLDINDEEFVVAYNRDLRELKNTIALNTRLEQLAYYDLLTGCASRLSFMETLNNEFNADSEFSLMMFDLDHFKFINDTYGHEAGDITLEKVVSRISSILPKGAVIGRYGGDEFMILEKDMKGDEVKVLMDCLIREIEVLDIHCVDNSFNTSISIGATYRGEHDTVDNIIKRADEALYKAKNQGRNRFELILPE